MPPETQQVSKASDHLANERTFLAWIRTSISIIVFGFVVAKFGITLRQFLRLQGQAPTSSGMSLGMGVVFMATGVVMAILALVRYRITMHRLEQDTFKPASAVIVVLGVITALLGVALGGYLILTASSL